MWSSCGRPRPTWVHVRTKWTLRSYYLRPPWRSLYSDRFETLLVRITCDDGTYGWGEALAPVAPEVVKAIVDRLLRPVLIGENPTRVRPLWTKLSGLMRERGHLGGPPGRRARRGRHRAVGPRRQDPRRARARPAGRRVPRLHPDLRVRAAQADRRRARRAGRRVGRPGRARDQAAPRPRRRAGPRHLRRGGRRAPGAAGSPSTRTGPTTWPTRCGSGAASTSAAPGSWRRRSRPRTLPRTGSWPPR